jgi:hypothetical protein
MPITLTIYLDLLFVIVFLGVPGLIIWLLVRRAIRRDSIRVLSPDEVAHRSEAEQDKHEAELHKPEEEWSLPPELNLPPPRPVRKGRLGIRMLRSLPSVLIITVVMGFLTFKEINWSHVPWKRFTFQAVLNFLQAPHWQRWMIGPSIVLVGWGIVGLYLLSGYFKRRKQQRFLRWGKPARAVVTDCKTSTQQGKNPTTWWTLQYQDAAGSLIQASLTGDNMPFGSKPGTVLAVLYDPDNPSRCIGYPVRGYEIVVPENS